MDEIIRLIHELSQARLMEVMSSRGNNCLEAARCEGRAEEVEDRLVEAIRKEVGKFANNRSMYEKE